MKKPPCFCGLSAFLIQPTSRGTGISEIQHQSLHIQQVKWAAGSSAVSRP
jgi:hypothetical protein